MLGSSPNGYKTYYILVWESYVTERFVDLPMASLNQSEQIMLYNLQTSRFVDIIIHVFDEIWRNLVEGVQN